MGGGARKLAVGICVTTMSALLLAAGCSQKGVHDPIAAAVDAGVVAQSDASLADDGPYYYDEGGPFGCPGDKTPTPAQYDDPTTGFGWAPPKQTLNACAAADLTALRTNFGNKMLATYGDLKTNISAGCQACLFTSVGLAANPDASGPWQEIVIFTQGGTEVGGLLNQFGACLSVATTPACGQAQFDADQCPDDLCSDCADQPSFATCTASAAVKSYCKSAFGPNVTSACGAGYADAYKACSGASKTGIDQIMNVANILCGTGVADVGDSGDAGDGG